MITKAKVYIIDSNQLPEGHRHFATFTRNGALATDAQMERIAHNRAAELLDTNYFGLWCYRYGALVEGVTLETPGVVISHPLAKDENGKYMRRISGLMHDYSQPYLDGVTDMSLIADAGFNGQFQWINGVLVNKVPAYIETEDAERDARYAAERTSRADAERRKAVAFKLKLKELPPMTLAPYKERDWEVFQEKNLDGYGSAVIFYADAWARLMEEQIHRHLGDDAPLNSPFKEYSVLGVLAIYADMLSHEADFVGLTGAQYGFAVGVLAQVWLYGAELRKWHNKEYGYEGHGVVNPAMLTVNLK